MASPRGQRVPWLAWPKAGDGRGEGPLGCPSVAGCWLGLQRVWLAVGRGLARPGVGILGPEGSGMARTSQQRAGGWAEQRALRLLQARGWILVARNWSCRWGELDLLMAKGDRLLVVEVKGRARAGLDQWALWPGLAQAPAGLAGLELLAGRPSRLATLQRGTGLCPGAPAAAPGAGALVALELGTGAVRRGNPGIHGLGAAVLGCWAPVGSCRSRCR
jgi:hypothetical protein